MVPVPVWFLHTGVLLYGSIPYVLTLPKVWVGCKKKPDHLFAMVIRILGLGLSLSALSPVFLWFGFFGSELTLSLSLFLFIKN